MNLKEAKAAIEQQYNYAITVYDYGDFLRFTNGSGGAMIDIRVSGDQYELVGRWYDREIEKTCERTTDALLNTLSATV